MCSRTSESRPNNSYWVYDRHIRFVVVLIETTSFRLANLECFASIPTFHRSIWKMNSKFVFCERSSNKQCFSNFTRSTVSLFLQWLMAANFDFSGICFAWHYCIQCIFIACDIRVENNNAARYFISIHIDKRIYCVFFSFNANVYMRYVGYLCDIPSHRTWIIVYLFFDVFIINDCRPAGTISFILI